MATLQKIRNKAGIWVAILIGLALLAFIMGDLFDTRTSVFQGSRSKVAEIGGKSVSIIQLEEKIKNIEEIYKINTGQNSLEQSVSDGIREQAWNDLVNEYVMEKEYNDLGITVSSDELFDLVQGRNPHPIISQLFTNPETGEFNKANLLSFLKNLNKEETGNAEEDLNIRNRLTYWLYIEGQIKSQQISSKYITLIQKGLSVPTFVAKNEINESGKKVDLNFVSMRLNSVPDSSVSINASDVKKYYKEHQYLYEQPTTFREIEYVTFNVVPSQADISEAQDWITKIKPDFIAATEVEAFVNSNSDEQYIDRNYSLKDLNDSIRTFVTNASEGDVYGPINEDNSYKLAKLYKVVSLPDSVKARHILVRPKGQTQEAYDLAKKMADSIKNEIQKGGSFDVLAKQYSEDRSNSEKGGDLGWFQEGSMVKPFNDAAFSASKGELKIVETNYGFHILKVEDKGKESKKYKIAYLVHKIEAGNQTVHELFTTANRFAAENNTYEKFNEAVKKQNLSKRFATVYENDKDVQQELTNARPLVRWAYQSKPKSISEPFDLTGKFVVAALVSVKNKGIMPLEQVKNEVELAVRKQKKIEKLTEKINQAKQGANSIQDVALKLNTTVEQAEGVSFTSYTIGTAGIQPKLIAYATNYPKNKLSDPVEGADGVYLIYVTAINEAPNIADLTNIKNRKKYMDLSVQSRINPELEPKSSLVKLADVEDERSKFY